MFKPFDGFYADLVGEVKATDAAITIRTKSALALATLAEGDWTYLTLNDSTTFEIVKVMGGFVVQPSARCVVADVPVQRGIQGVAQNFGPIAYAAYRIVTPIVEDLIAEHNTGSGSLAPFGTIGDIGQECRPDPNGPGEPGPQGALAPVGAMGPHGVGG